MHPDLTRSFELHLCAAAFAYVHANHNVTSGYTRIACTYNLNLTRLIAWYKTLDADLVRKVCEDEILLKSMFGYNNFYKQIVNATISSPPQ